jgi:hypothetical protein
MILKTVQDYIKYCLTIDSNMNFERIGIDLNDDMVNVNVSCSEDKNGRIIVLKRKSEVV